MKAIGKICIPLVVVLLALANLAFVRQEDARQVATQPKGSAINLAAYRTHSDPPLYQAEHKAGTSSQSNASSTFCKYPFAPSNISAVALSRRLLAGDQYFMASSILRIGLEVSDIIFPFHHFW